MKKYKKELCFLSTCSKSQRSNFVKKAPTDVIKAISDISNTILYGKLKLTTSQRQSLRKDIKILNELALKKNSFAKKTQNYFLSKWRYYHWCYLIIWLFGTL
jgi:hypothetical protein